MNPDFQMLGRKLEDAIIAFVKANAPPELRCLPMVAGHTNEEPKMPYHVCAVVDLQPHPDMPPEIGIKSCTVVWHQKSNASDELRQAADARLREAWETIIAPTNPDAPIGDDNRMCSALIVALNKPASVPDARPVKGLNVYDFYPGDERDQFQGKVWHDQLTFTAVAQPYDSH